MSLRNSIILILIIFQFSKLESNLFCSNFYPRNEEDCINIESQLKQFIPEGYSILDTASGDLNSDRLDDLILVLKKNGEDSLSEVTEHPEPRPLLLLIRQTDNNYKLVVRNDSLVYCVDCGGVMGDPFVGVEIKYGTFTIYHYGGSAWRWNNDITFKYLAIEKNWYLVKEYNASFNANEPEKIKKKIRTSKHFGKIPFSKYNIYNSK